MRVACAWRTRRTASLLRDRAGRRFDGQTSGAGDSLLTKPDQGQTANTQDELSPQNTDGLAIGNEVELDGAPISLAESRLSLRRRARPVGWAVGLRDKTSDVAQDAIWHADRIPAAGR